MENSVKNYEIEDIINGGMISNKKRKWNEVFKFENVSCKHDRL